MLTAVLGPPPVTFWDEDLFPWFLHKTTYDDIFFYVDWQYYWYKINAKFNFIIPYLII
jgi:hypothetical protein